MCRDARLALRVGEWADASATAMRALGLGRAATLLDVPAEAVHGEFVARLERLRFQALENRFDAGSGWDSTGGVPGPVAEGRARGLSRWSGCCRAVMVLLIPGWNESGAGSAVPRGRGCLAFVSVAGSLRTTLRASPQNLEKQRQEPARADGPGRISALTGDRQLRLP
jgi:hypothetical protein